MNMQNNPLLDQIGVEQNSTGRTANGAVTNVSSLNNCVDLFGSIASMRSQSDASVISIFTKAFAEDPLKSLKILFWNRDIRGGAGERKTSRTILKYLAETQTDIIRKNLNLISEYGRWDDYLVFIGTPLEKDVLDLLKEQFSVDSKAIANGSDDISLLMKWLPSENTSSEKTKALAKKVRSHFGFTPRQYRKILSIGRKKLKVVERDISAKNYKAINYQGVPSRAGMIYRNSFKKNDGTRYEQFLSDVENGKSKINTSTLYPYDIVHKARSVYDKTLDLQWNNLPNYVEPFNGLVICDVSGSMSGREADAPINVAVSLAMYIAERNEGIWKDKFFTFSETPTLQTIQGSNITEKIRNIKSSDWGMSTNFQATFDKILETAIESGLTDEQLPKKLFCISDMEFNSADKFNSGWGWEASMGNEPRSITNFEAIKAKYSASGYTMPELVFWNVNAREGNVPVTVDDKGVALVSGCSPSILQAVLTGEILTPIDVMNKAIETERYQDVSI